LIRKLGRIAEDRAGLRKGRRVDRGEALKERLVRSSRVRLSHGDGGLAPGVERREVKPFGLERRRGARTARDRTAAAAVLSVLGPSCLLRKDRRVEIWLHDPREQAMNGTRPVGLRPELLDRFGGGFHEGRSIRLPERLGERENSRFGVWMHWRAVPPRANIGRLVEYLLRRLRHDRRGPFRSHSAPAMIRRWQGPAKRVENFPGLASKL
jgi:hypothetical protein